MIPEIGIGNIGIGNVGVGDINFTNVNQPVINTPYYIAEPPPWMVEPSVAVPHDVPVTVDIGSPVVDMPGCVEVNKENLERPPNQNQSLVNDDPRQNVVLCDGELPAYNPINYDPRKLRIEDLTPPKKEEEYKHRGNYSGDGVPDGGVGAEPPDTKQPDPIEDPPCPGPNAPRIGDVAQNQTEKVSGFELQRDPRNPDGVKICVTLYEDIGTVESFLPSPQVVTTTATIAVVATSSALLAKPLADLLLKVVKPAIKKVMGAIQKKLGKTPYRPTQSEIRTNKYREKKGLLGINFAKRAKKGNQ